MKRYMEPVIKIAMFRDESVVVTSGYIQSVDDWVQNNSDARKAMVDFDKMKELIQITF